MNYTALESGSMTVLKPSRLRYQGNLAVKPSTAASNVAFACSTVGSSRDAGRPTNCHQSSQLRRSLVCVPLSVWNSCE